MQLFTENPRTMVSPYLFCPMFVLFYSMIVMFFPSESFSDIQHAEYDLSLCYLIIIVSVTNFIMMFIKFALSYVTREPPYRSLSCFILYILLFNLTVLNRKQFGPLFLLYATLVVADYGTTISSHIEKYCPYMYPLTFNAYYYLVAPLVPEKPTFIMRTQSLRIPIRSFPFRRLFNVVYNRLTIKFFVYLILFGFFTIVLFLYLYPIFPIFLYVFLMRSTFYIQQIAYENTEYENMRYFSRFNRTQSKKLPKAGRKFHRRIKFRSQAFFDRFERIEDILDVPMVRNATSLIESVIFLVYHLCQSTTKKGYAIAIASFVKSINGGDSLIFSLNEYMGDIFDDKMSTQGFIDYMNAGKDNHRRFKDL